MAEWGCGGKKKTAVSRILYLVSRISGTADWGSRRSSLVARGRLRPYLVSRISYLAVRQAGDRRPEAGGRKLGGASLVAGRSGDVEALERRWVDGFGRPEPGRVCDARRIYASTHLRFYAFTLLRAYGAASRRARRILARVLASSGGMRSALICRVAAARTLSRAAGSSRAAERQ